MKICNRLKSKRQKLEIYRNIPPSREFISKFQKKEELGEPVEKYGFMKIMYWAKNEKRVILIRT